MNEFNEYQKEAKERYKNTEAYIEYSEKTKNYTKEKWSEVSEKLNDIFYEFSFHLKNNTNPSSIEILQLVEKLQNHITENYYKCTNEILLGLGQMYINDQRFKNNIDKFQEGTAEFINKSIQIYCK